MTDAEKQAAMAQRNAPKPSAAPAGPVKPQAIEQAVWDKLSDSQKAAYIKKLSKPRNGF